MSTAPMILRSFTREPIASDRGLLPLGSDWAYATESEREDSQSLSERGSVDYSALTMSAMNSAETVRLSLIKGWPG